MSVGTVRNVHRYGIYPVSAALCIYSLLYILCLHNAPHHPSHQWLRTEAFSIRCFTHFQLFEGLRLRCVTAWLLGYLISTVGTGCTNLVKLCADTVGTGRYRYAYMKVWTVCRYGMFLRRYHLPVRHGSGTPLPINRLGSDFRKSYRFCR
jgi:hypothetical protein